MLRLFLLALAMVVAPTAASAGWLVAKSKHFNIYSEQSKRDLQEFAQELEQFDRGVRLLSAMEDPPLTDSGRLTLYVLGTKADVATMAGGPARGVAGFYIGRASGPLAFVHSEKEERDSAALTARTVFFHEYQHHLMLQSQDVALPLWVVEGYAEFFATARREKDGSLVFGSPPQHRAFGLFQLDSLTIEEMVGVTAQKIDIAEREQIYARGWLLVHMLVFDQKRKGQLGAYIANIQKGVSTLTAARSAFGDLKLLDRDLKSYLSKRKFAGFSVPKAAFAASDIAIRELSPAESAILPTVMRSERGVNSTVAPRVLERARKVAARFPSDPAVLAALAEAEQDAGNNMDAVAAADKALAAIPNHGKAMIMKTRALLAAGRKEPAKADWNGIRALIGKVNKLDPDDAEPLMLFYESYTAQGMRPTRNAVEGLLYALQLVPQDDTLRMLAVRQMVNDKKLAEAERLYGPLAYNPHASAEARESMLKVMTALKAGNGKEVTTLLDVEKKKAESKAAGKS